MATKKTLLKMALIIFIVNVCENLLLLLFFGVKIEKGTVVGALLFTAVLTFLLDKMVLDPMRDTE